MNIPVEIVATGLGLFGTAIFAAVSYGCAQILKINVRLARIEEHMGIAENKKTKKAA